jgi:hypothetical protein
MREVVSPCEVIPESPRARQLCDSACTQRPPLPGQGPHETHPFGLRLPCRRRVRRTANGASSTTPAGTVGLTVTEYHQHVWLDTPTSPPTWPRATG